MRNTEIVKIVGMVFILLLSLVFYKMVVASVVAKKKSEQEFFVKSQKKGRSFKLLKLYNFLVDYKPTRRYLEKLRRIYEVREPGNTRECKESAMRLALIIWGIDVALIVSAIVFRFSMYKIGLCMLTSYVVSNQLVIMQMERCDNDIIAALSDFVDLVQFHFFNLGVPSEALLAAIQETPSRLMKMHGQKIYDVLGETEQFEEAVKDYNLQNTDFYLKAFAEAVFVIHQYGDKIVDDESLFVYTLRSIKNDIRDEMLKRRKISNKFMMMQFCVVSPIFTLDLLKGVGSDHFSTLTDLYGGTYGYVTMILLFIVVLVVYMIINKLRVFVKVESTVSPLIKNVYRWRPVKRMVNSMLYRNWGKTLRLREELKKTGNPLNEKYFLTKKVMCFCICFILCFIALNVIHVNSRYHYVNSVTNLSSSTSGASDEEGYKMMLIGKYYLDKYKKYDVRKEYNRKSGQQPDSFFNDEVEDWLVQLIISDMTADAIKLNRKDCYDITQAFLGEHSGTSMGIKSLAGLTYEEASASDDHMISIGFSFMEKTISKCEKPGALMKDSLNQLVAEKVAGKIRKSQNEYFHWWELIIVFGVALTGYWAPTIMMNFERKALQMDMEDEIVQFQTVILVLMHMDRMTQEKILEWMLMFSRIFEGSLRKCVNDFPLGSEEALNRLTEDEPFEPFVHLIEAVRMVDKVGVSRAFGNLKSDRKNYQEKRKLENDIAIEKKVSTANFLNLVPFEAIIVLYLVVPFIIAAVGDFTAAMTSLNTTAGGM